MEKKNIIIGVLLFAIIIMLIAFYGIKMDQKIPSKSKIEGKWNIKITSITSEKGGKAINNIEPVFTTLTAEFNPGFQVPTDYIIYTIIVENKGTITAKLNKLVLSKNNNIKTTIMSKNIILKQGEQKRIKIKIQPSGNITNNNYQLASLDFIQK